MQYIEKTFHISIIEHWKRWPHFIEVFERRNLIAHGEKNFTERYVAICRSHHHKGAEKTLGTPIKLSFFYLRQSIEILLEFAVLLIFSLWRKHLPSEERQAFDMIGGTSFKLIQHQEYTVAVRVLEYVLGLKNVNVSDQTRKMMVVNLASSHAHQKNNAKCNEVLDSQDWSGSADNYKICVAALKRDTIEVCRLLPIVVSAGTINKNDIRNWPVFDFVRNDPSIVQKFQDLFGEPILLRAAPSDSTISGEQVEDLALGPETLH